MGITIYVLNRRTRTQANKNRKSSTVITYWVIQGASVALKGDNVLNLLC